MYLLLQSSSELPMCSLFLKKSTFLLYTIMCILHVECDCGMYVGDSIYISVVPPNYTYNCVRILFPVWVPLVMHFFNVDKMNCCRIAGLDFFLSFFPLSLPFSLLLFPLLLFVCLFVFFLFCLLSEGTVLKEGIPFLGQSYPKSHF